METSLEPIEQPVPTIRQINLRWTERVISVIAGVQIGLWGFKNLFKNPGSSIVKIGAGGYLLNRGITGHCDLYDLAGKKTTGPVFVNINTSVTVDKPRDEVYAFWRDLSNLPLFMSHLNSVEVMDDTRSYWSLKLPVDIADIYWDAVIIDDIPGELIEWSSLPDSVIETSGMVRFIDTNEPGETLVHIALNYQPPAGALGAGLARIFNPMFKKMIEDDIQNFKRYMDIAAVIENE